MKIVFDRKIFFIKRYFLLDCNANDYSTFLFNCKQFHVCYIDSLSKQIIPHSYEYIPLTYLHNLDNFCDDNDLYYIFNKTIRNAINQCRTQKVKFHFYNSNDISNKLLSRIKKIAKNFYENKNLKFEWNTHLLKSYKKNNSLLITCIFDYEGNISAFHVYKLSDIRSTLYYSITNLNLGIERNTIGKQNRYLHYLDMMYIKKLGIKYYDWGQISRGNPNEGISSFKKSFDGGEVLNTYRYKVINGFMGRILHKLHLV